MVVVFELQKVMKQAHTETTTPLLENLEKLLDKAKKLDIPNEELQEAEEIFKKLQTEINQVWQINPQINLFLTVRTNGWLASKNKLNCQLPMKRFALFLVACQVFFTQDQGHLKQGRALPMSSLC